MSLSRNKEGSPLIVLENVTFRTREGIVFENTDWRMNYGEHWAVTGPNGSGKSLFARSIAGYLPVIGGCIKYHFNGNHGSEYKPSPDPGEVIVLSQETLRNVLGRYSNYHQARWQSFEGDSSPAVRTLLSGSGIERLSDYQTGPLRVDEEVYTERRDYAVRLLGIGELLERRVMSLSHGELKKTLIARALMREPKLLVLDDPFCGLDIGSRESFMRTLDGLMMSGKVHLMLIVRRPEEIPQGTTHVLYVDECRIRAGGPAADMLTPASAGALFSGESHNNQSYNELKLDSMREPEYKGPEALVDLRNVSITYGGIKVLDNITWKVKRGEHWAVLGPNGAGKSTLLSLVLADNPQAYANDIRLFGKKRGSGEAIWEIKRFIGHVSPELQFYYRKQALCRDVVGSGFFDSVGLFRECSKDQNAAVTMWMECFGIPGLSMKLFNELSAGEQRLVLLARALVKMPVLLVLDEPCQGLDPAHRGSFVSLIDRLCSYYPLTLIYVTHRPDEMPPCITRVLRLDRGQIR
ncbi:MAG: ATP-binding cassette domain-containing protein [Spirochaetales bacterium]|nr:ATP-binding cassette domain-containing protein [Spirochaetales bacterium]